MRWLGLPDDVKSKIKQETLITLGSPTSRIGSYAATVIASIAAIELPENQWSDLIQILLGFINNRENISLRIATLTAIGYICESIVSSHVLGRECRLIPLRGYQKPEVLASRSNEILTAVVQGARKEEINAEVNASAMRALFNSLEFVRENFEREVTSAVLFESQTH